MNNEQTIWEGGVQTDLLYVSFQMLLLHVIGGSPTHKSISLCFALMQKETGDYYLWLLWDFALGSSFWRYLLSLLI